MSAPAPAGGAGTLSYALAALPADLDPLAAASVDAQTVTRQVHEPLVATVAPPYGGAAAEAGLATALRPSADRTVWTVQLRPGVRFGDGAAFDAGAVLANARRWASRPAGRRLLPDLFAVDSPRPKEVRFLFDRPVGNLPALLSSPRLGIVSPRALRPEGGGGAVFRSGVPGSGTGAFALGERGSGSLGLARNPGWWGSSVGLGPALDGVRFVRAPAAADRLALLRTGEVQAAQPLDRGALATVEADPLLSAVAGTGGGIGTEASVRGIEPGSGPPVLSGVWLTTIGG